MSPFDPFLAWLLEHRLPAPQTEVLFAPPRKWRADYLWKYWERNLIVEVEGGLFAGGRAGRAHAQPTSILRDMEKSNAAQVLGYVYLRYTPDQLMTPQSLADLKQVLGKVGK